MKAIQNILGYKKIFSIFPELYNYREFSPLLIRLSLGLLFITEGWRTASKKNGVTAVNLTLGGIKIITGALLAVALYTQPAAILGTFLSLGKLISDVRNRESQTDLIRDLIVLVSTLSLLLTGPGAYSIDLPL